MAIRLSENFRALFYAPFYAAHAIGAYQAEGVEVELLLSPDPARTAAALRSGEIDAMWGGPLRVMLTHAQDPAADSVCFCDVIARDPFFIIGREPRPDFRVADLATVRFASVAEVPTPWLCLQDDLRRAGVDPATLNRISGPSMADNAAALRAGSLDAVQLFQPYAEELIASGAGHVWYAAADRGLTAYTTLVTRRPLLAVAARRTAAHDPRHRAHAALDRRDAGRRHRPRAGGFLPRRVARTSLPPRSTAIARLNCSPPTRCCGARASIGCRRPCDPAVRSIAPSRSSAASTIRWREQALADFSAQR